MGLKQVISMKYRNKCIVRWLQVNKLYCFIFSSMLFMSSQLSGAEINYEIFQVLSNKKLLKIDSGTVNYSVHEAQVTEKGVTGWITEKWININNEFSIGIVDSKERKINGLGMWGKYNNNIHLNQFSWEWFELAGPGKFVKHHGNGRLKVKTSISNGNEEVVFIEFLDDIFINVKTGNKFQGDEYKIVIKSDSTMVFPLLRTEPPE